MKSSCPFVFWSFEATVGKRMELGAFLGNHRSVCKFSLFRERRASLTVYVFGEVGQKCRVPKNPDWKKENRPKYLWSPKVASF